ncbi:MAG: IPT/TIG domain-containing protein [Candidatus Binatia bacterium]
MPTIVRYVVHVSNLDGSGNSTIVSVTINPALVSSPPTVSSGDPKSGTAGTAVTIKGKNFGSSQGTSFVRFGNTNATVNFWDDTQIIAVAPDGPSSGSVTGITVTTAAGPSNSDKTFSYHAPPVLVVPGIYGSWSTELFCNTKSAVKLFEDGVKHLGSKLPKQWTLDPFLNTYEALIFTLLRSG